MMPKWSKLVGNRFEILLHHHLIDFEILLYQLLFCHLFLAIVMYNNASKKGKIAVKPRITFTPSRYFIVKVIILLVH